jgi:uncharacterized protein (DUF2235 family)
MCSDGTGNTFDERITNVSRMVRFLDASDASRQVIRYDPGVGTVAARTENVRAECTVDGAALKILPAANRAQRGPVAWLDRMCGLAFGYGLKKNVFQLYAELAALCPGPEDQLFLFGFSRGAFTVRALAGLLHRCYLPAAAGHAELRERFDRAWRLFKVMRPDAAEVEAIRRGQRPCPVHFLGVWDTVKSYGGLIPVVLPHLRHNPDVSHVRHAVALDERRAWFKPTTWGGLDSDEHAAMTRLTERDAAACRSQTSSRPGSPAAIAMSVPATSRCAGCCARRSRCLLAYVSPTKACAFWPCRTLHPRSTSRGTVGGGPWNNCRDWRSTTTKSGRSADGTSAATGPAISLKHGAAAGSSCIRRSSARRCP